MAPMKPDNTISKAELAARNPHPSFIQVAKPYIFEQTIEDCMTAIGVSTVREDSYRLQGVAYIDNVRKKLNLPVRTFNTAVVYYHKFRLVHPDTDYNWVDAAAAALFTACKIEDTLKKSRDILCTAYNLKLPPAEHLSSDEAVFEASSRSVIGLERLMLEASGFDFRNRHPQKLLIKLSKYYGVQRGSSLARTAYTMSLDLYRTFAPLKQTSATMAYACLELSARLIDDQSEGLATLKSGEDYKKWHTSRVEVMETMRDLCSLYTDHRSSSTLGLDYTIDTFLNISISLKQESDSHHLQRYTYWRKRRGNAAQNGAGKETNGAKGGKGKHLPNLMAPTAVVDTNGKKTGERGRDGTVRFMLNPEDERNEKNVVLDYYKMDEEEYEIEVEVKPQPRSQQQQHHHHHHPQKGGNQHHRYHGPHRGRR